MTACLRAIAAEKGGPKVALSQTSKWMQAKLAEYMEALSQRSAKGVMAGESKESGGKVMGSHYC